MTASRTWSVVSKPMGVRLRGSSGLTFQPTWVQSGADQIVQMEAASPGRDDQRWCCPAHS